MGPMSVETSIQVENELLVWPQSTIAHIKLINNGPERLTLINPGNVKGSASIILTDEKNGERTLHAKLRQPEIEQPEISLDPGSQMGEVTNLSRVLQFPSCGIFELRARHEWHDGEIESEPAFVQIVPARPRAVSLTTRRGSNAGNVFAAWVNKDDGGYSLWLSEIGTNWEAQFLSSVQIVKLSGLYPPVLSVPANTIATNMYVAWIEHDKLRYVVANTEPATIRDVALNAEGYEIVGPLFEDPYVEGTKQDADALLYLKQEDGWELRKVRLGADPYLEDEAFSIIGDCPLWLKNVYRASGERMTFVLLPRSSPDGSKYVSLGVTEWDVASRPLSIRFLQHWKGDLLCAELVMTADNKVKGAVLMCADDQVPEYTVNGWQLGNENDFSSSPAHSIVLPMEGNAGRSLINVNGRGDTFAMIWNEARGVWYWIDERGNISPINDLTIDAGAPVGGIFVNEVYPAILYRETDCGLKLQYLGPKLTYRPSSGAF